jgi:cell division protein ZapA (FtsZ GTPase activity inhibitor)
MAEIALKVLIAGRVYPLTVKQEEEEPVLQAAKLINEKMKEFEQNYSVRDKQDLLAMCALNLLVTEQNIHKNASEPEKELFQLDLFISDYLQKQSTAE